MIDKIKVISEIINKEIELHKDLLKLLQEEQNILVNQKFENLEANLLGQLDIIEQIKIDEDKRIKAVNEISEEIGSDTEEIDVDTILEHIENENEKEQLFRSKEYLKELLRNIKRINDGNDFLIKNSLSFLEKNIKVLLKGTDKEEFYDKSNNKKKDVHGKVFDWKV